MGSENTYSVFTTNLCFVFSKICFSYLVFSRAHSSVNILSFRSILMANYWPPASAKYTLPKVPWPSTFFNVKSDNCNFDYFSGATKRTLFLFCCLKSGKLSFLVLCSLTEWLSCWRKRSSRWIVRFYFSMYRFSFSSKKALCGKIVLFIWIRCMLEAYCFMSSGTTYIGRFFWCMPK